ncbi:MAG: hypothetical protein JSW42_06085 [Chloroflexota bacterium]|nr:MAG: hypothetical protein JSW42_06085 [Chloroflexota bacterium]
MMKKLVHNPRFFWVWFFASAVIYSWILLGPFGEYFENQAIRLAILAFPVAISMILIHLIWSGVNKWTALLVTLIGYSVLYKLFNFLPGVNTYPFTLTWSEGTAYYFASLFFAERIYGIDVNLPLINPTRHMLMAVPFLVSGLPIWVHRLWEVFLWLLISGTTIFLFVRRLEIQANLIRWAYFGWFFLFMFQGPIYYFLLLSIIPVLWGFEPKNFRKTLLLVVIGSVWAGASRVNWFPVPALIAATLYFIEEKIGERSWQRYVANPIVWLVAGTATALLSWYTYARLSGNPIGDFGIYFTSNLLWYRLLPNETFREGVLFMALLASVPLLGIIGIHIYTSRKNYHPIRLLGIGSIMLVLFLGGLIVSTKIGGGNNIHNLDAYLLILLITGSYIYFGRTFPDYDKPEKETPGKLVNIFVSLAVLIPVLFAIQDGKPTSRPKPAKAENARRAIQEYSTDVVSNGGKVLFIAERQLLTFGEIEDIPLIPEYERMNLMEMVMGGNQAYLDEFHKRIENQEFDLIVTEPLKIKFKGRTESFGVENDVYVRDVSKPVLCYYETVKKISRFPIQLLVPKIEPDNCS